MFTYITPPGFLCQWIKFHFFIPSYSLYLDHRTFSNIMGSISDDGILDALIVGAGFGGVYQLKQLRDNGFNVKLVDSASDFGGVWYWNRYPGARVDSTVPHYEFSDPGLWKDWSWKQRFPGSQELRDYFSFTADRWDLRIDTEFNTFVSSAVFDEEKNHWNITSSRLGTSCSTPVFRPRDTFPTGRVSTSSKAHGFILHTGPRKSLIFAVKRSLSSGLALQVCSSLRSSVKWRGNSFSSRELPIWPCL